MDREDPSYDGTSGVPVMRPHQIVSPRHVRCHLLGERSSASLALPRPSGISAVSAGKSTTEDMASVSGVSLGQAPLLASRSPTHSSSEMPPPLSRLRTGGLARHDLGVI